MKQDQQGRRVVMAILKVIVVLFVMFVVGLVGLFFAIRLMVAIEKNRVPEMTPEKAQKLFEKAGGINEVNRETGELFDRLGTNSWTFLYPEDLTSYPAVFFFIRTWKSILEENIAGREPLFGLNMEDISKSVLEIMR
jgi:hypothetical protein